MTYKPLKFTQNYKGRHATDYSNEELVPLTQKEHKCSFCELDATPLNFAACTELCKGALSKLLLHGRVSGITFSGGSTYLERNFNFHLNTFLRRLARYDTMQVKKIFNGTYYAIRCLQEGPSFAKWLKDTREANLNYHIGELIMGEEDADLILDEWSGYNCLLSPRFLMPWTDEVNDIYWSMLEEPDPPEWFYHEFRAFLDAYKLENLENMPLANILSDSNSRYSGRYINYSRKRQRTKKSFPHAEAMASEKFQNQVHDKLHYTRSVVYASPESIRDTVTVAAPHLHMVKRFNHLTNLIQYNLPYTVRHEDASSYSEIGGLLEKPGINVMLDIKKCGLTFPRKVGKLMIKAMMELYPLASDLSFGYAIFDGVLIDREGLKIETNRGYHLGMANDLPTMLQSFCLWKWRQERKIPIIRGRFFNDDSVIKFSKRILRNFEEGTELKEVLIFLAQTLMETFESVNLIMKRCVVSIDKAYFLEEYWIHPFDGSKTQLPTLSTCVVDMCHNIEHAHKLITSEFELLSPTILQESLDLIKSKWGYRIHPIEYLLPYSVGGWLPHHNRGISYTLVSVIKVWEKHPLITEIFINSYLENEYPERAKYTTRYIIPTNEDWIEHDLNRRSDILLSELRGTPEYKEVVHKNNIRYNLLKEIWDLASAVLHDSNLVKEELMIDPDTDDLSAEDKADFEALKLHGLTGIT